MATVLIVEDNENVAKFYALALERAGGIDVLQGESGDAVIETVRSGKVDLVLLDISLAEFTCQGRQVNGLELARLLKDNEATRAIPILLATAHAMEGDREKFLASSGADGYLQKPIYEPQVLVETVRSLLAKDADPPGPASA